LIQVAEFPPLLDGLVEFPALLGPLLGSHSIGALLLLPC